MDNDLKGEGNSLNYTFRMHDPRVGRSFAVDPLSTSYPHNSPCAFSEKRVIDGIDLEGMEWKSEAKFDLKLGITTITLTLQIQVIKSFTVITYVCDQEIIVNNLKTEFANMYRYNESKNKINYVAKLEETFVPKPANYDYSKVPKDGLYLEMFDAVAALNSNYTAGDSFANETQKNRFRLSVSFNGILLSID